MTECAFNLLTTPFFHTEPNALATLPGLLALLARDQVENYPALRPHQAPAWHMFLVQLAALAMHRADLSELPDTEAEWTRVLRGLTPEFPGDEPWSLVVEDKSKPAFMQPPIPQGIKLDTEVATPDALDLLITSRNHDLKQAVARQAAVQDWVFALISLQTSEGFGGAKNYGIVRMNGGSSSRPLFTLAPLTGDASKSNQPRPGAWFSRDVSVLLATRKEEVTKFGHIGYPAEGGLGLVWTADWPEGDQLPLQALDMWFIEVCRRIRFVLRGSCIACARGGSSAPRIDAKKMNGALGDPWGPIHKTENKAFTLSSSDFDYSKLVELLISGDWILPLLARPAVVDTNQNTMALVAQALSRGNSKTEGFKSRVLPIGGRISHALGARRKELHQLAQDQMAEIEKFDKVLRFALALFAERSGSEKPRKEHYAYTTIFKEAFDRAVDAIFFEHLWARFEAQDVGQEAKQAEALRFIRQLYELAQSVFEEALPAMPCAKLFRPRAEVRARRAFHNSIRCAFPELVLVRGGEEANDADA